MESEIKLLKEKMFGDITEENIMLLKDQSIPFDKDKFKKLYDLYKKYKSEKRNFANIKDESGEEKYKTVEQYNKYIRNEAYKISPSLRELANLAVSICYEAYPSDNKAFVWCVFGDGIIENINDNRQKVSIIPYIDDGGTIEFLGSKYSNFEIKIDNLSEDIYAYL